MIEDDGCDGVVGDAIVPCRLEYVIVLWITWQTVLVGPWVPVGDVGRERFDVSACAEAVAGVLQGGPPCLEEGPYGPLDTNGDTIGDRDRLADGSGDRTECWNRAEDIPGGGDSPAAAAVAAAAADATAALFRRLDEDADAMPGEINGVIPSRRDVAEGRGDGTMGVDCERL